MRKGMSESGLLRRVQPDRTIRIGFPSQQEPIRTGRNELRSHEPWRLKPQMQSPTTRSLQPVNVPDDLASCDSVESPPTGPQLRSQLRTSYRHAKRPPVMTEGPVREVNPPWFSPPCGPPFSPSSGPSGKRSPKRLRHACALSASDWASSASRAI